MTVATTRARAAARRVGPRLIRLGLRWWRNLLGVLVALVLAAWLWGRPILLATVASTRWSYLAAGTANRIRSLRVSFIAAALLGLTWLTWAWWVAWVFAIPAALWVIVRTGMAIYPHTERGRLRTAYPPEGLATFWQLWRHLSAHAARQATPAMRPTVAAALPYAPETREQVKAVGRGVAAASRARRLALLERLPITEAGTWLGRSVPGPVLGMNLYCPHRDVVGLVAGPQSGKSALIGHHILDHAGPVVSTSTKVDLFQGTSAARAERGTVHLFNPEVLGGLASTLRWSPVAGCRHGRVARRRAEHMVTAVTPAGGSDEGAQWSKWATGVLAALLMAAARGGKTMADVAHWCYSENEGTRRALDLLHEGFDGAVPQLVIDALSQVATSAANRTRASIFISLRDAVGFMVDPVIAEACTPGPDDVAFDPASFVRSRDTLFLVGADEGTTAPLVSALTGEVFEIAKTVASTLPAERLDPALMLALDEAALCSPVPLQRWLADSGGRGIHTIWSVQSLSQLADVWGPRAADTILNATANLLFYGGAKLDADLSAISNLTGTRLELVPDPDENGRSRLERVPTITPSGVRMIPAWHALLIARSAPPTIVRITPYWQRSDLPRSAPVRDVAGPDRYSTPTSHDNDPATGPIPVVSAAA